MEDKKVEIEGNHSQQKGDDNESQELKEDLNDEEISDEMLDDAFNFMSKQIQKDREKRIKKEKSLQKKENADFICKVCGKTVTPLISSLPPRTCDSCGVSICSKCSSCGYCLHCYVNLHYDSRKTLKLMRRLTITMPLFFLFFLRFNIQFYIFINLSLLIFIRYYFSTKKEVKKHGNHLIKKKWFEFTKTDEYKKYLNHQYPHRVIPPEIIEDENVIKEKKINKLQRWVEYDKEIKSVPIPAYIESDETKEPKNVSYSHEVISDEEMKKIMEEENEEYKLIGKKCPECNKTVIEFADFCPDCNIRFCPKCGLDHPHVAGRCFCGKIFVPLESEFQIWLQKKKN